jgi:two-component system, OmpR family, response regulator
MLTLHSPERAATATRAPGRLSVLVVEDNPDTLTTTARLVQLSGYAVAAATTGEEALRAVAEHDPDVVLLDLGLPGMDGYDLAKRLRLRAASKRPLLVAVTGYGKDEDKARAAAAGIDLHLTKPADPRMLLGVLHRMQRLLYDLSPNGD